MEVRKIDLLIISLIIILLLFNGILLALSFLPSQTQTSKPPVILQVSNPNTLILAAKPSLPHNIPNSDLKFNGEGFLSPEGWSEPKELELYKGETYGWKGNLYSDQTSQIDHRSGFLVVWPSHEKDCKYVETPSFILPSRGYVVVGVANGENKLPYAGNKIEKADSLFKIYLVDISKNITFPLDKVIISAAAGWADLAYDVSDLELFQGDRVRIRIEVCAGGVLHPWWGEWGIIDYIDVIK